MAIMGRSHQGTSWNIPRKVYKHIQSNRKCLNSGTQCLFRKPLKQENLTRKPLLPHSFHALRRRSHPMLAITKASLKFLCCDEPCRTRGSFGPATRGTPDSACRRPQEWPFTAARFPNATAFDVENETHFRFLV